MLHLGEVSRKGQAVMPSAVWCLWLLAALCDPWGWHGFYFHFLPSEENSPKSFSFHFTGVFSLPQKFIPCGFCKTSCILGLLSHMLNFFCGSFFYLCPSFSLLRKLSSLSITKSKWLSCSSLAFSVFLLHFKITVFGSFQYFMELHLSSLVSDVDIASSLTISSAQEVLCNLSK